MLKLIENTIARRQDWSTFEQSLRFSVSLLAWWGSFRLGEIVGDRRHEFNSKSILLASDVTFNEDCVAVWLRSPKVEKEVTGDLVEVWSVPDRPDLDPLAALNSYLRLRTSKFGPAEELPLFLHEDGSIFTKQEMNRDLSQLLSLYPQLNTARDKWTGHCYRSGLSTILAILGFSKSDIQSWGRWESDSYKRSETETIYDNFRINSILGISRTEIIAEKFVLV